MNILRFALIHLIETNYINKTDILSSLESTYNIMRIDLKDKKDPGEFKVKNAVPWEQLYQFI